MLPVLFTFPGGFALHSYGFALGCVMFISVFGAIRLGREDGVKAEVIYDLTIISIVTAVIGSRLEYVRTHWSDKFAQAPLDILDIRGGGYVFFGGLLAAVLADIVYLRVKKADIGTYADVAIVFIILGVGIARLGCFGAGCCYGLPSDVPWAVTFPEGAIAPAGIARHPTQLYESAYSFALAGFALWLRGRRTFRGEVALIIGVIYPLLRFVQERYRGDGERGWAIEGVLTNGQATGLGIAVACALAWVWVRARRPTGTA